MPVKHTSNPQRALAALAADESKRPTVVIDATATSAGRLASVVAKRLITGDNVHIVNSEKATVSGTLDAVLARYDFKRTVGTRRKGPFQPRMPHLLLKRTVRGMLNYQALATHRAAYKRLKCHIGVPDELADHEIITEQAALSNAYQRVRLETLCRRLGAKF